MEKKSQESASNLQEDFKLEATSSPEATIPLDAGKRTSGYILRRQYVIQETDNFFKENDRKPQPEFVSVLESEARKLYPQDGDYEVKNGVATYLGIK